MTAIAAGRPALPPWAAPGDGTPSWPGSHVLVAGLRVAGEAVVRVLRTLGATVTVVDAGDGPPQREAAARAAALGATVLLGHDPATGLPGPVDLVVTSPGLRPGNQLLSAAAAAGIPVWGDIELAWRLRVRAGGAAPAPWLAVTGTNGKTTTTQMLTAVLRAAGLRTEAAANIGTPLVEVVTADPPYEVLAVELSSFELHWTDSVCPVAATILNIAGDHYDWHGDAQRYAEAKLKVWSPSTLAVANADDEGSMALLPRAAGRDHVTFGRDSGGITVVDGVIVDRAFSGGAVLPVAELQVTGAHNVSNALAATALARAFGVGVDAIATALAAFRPDHHRNETVTTVRGVRYVNDSKATNPHAAAASLAAYPAVVWIAGGLNKGLAFDELVEGARDRLRAAVLIGSCAAELADALARHAPGVPVVQAAGMQDAVKEAAALAGSGDTVLLAPAVASMDMFRDYGHRGEVFAAAVRALTEESR